MDRLLLHGGGYARRPGRRSSPGCTPSPSAPTTCGPRTSIPPPRRCPRPTPRWFPTTSSASPNTCAPPVTTARTTQKTDYQFEPPLTAWDELGPRAHWRNRPDPEQPFFAVFNLVRSHESGAWPEKCPSPEFDPGGIQTAALSPGHAGSAGGHGPHVHAHRPQRPGVRIAPWPAGRGRARGNHLGIQLERPRPPAPGKTLALRRRHPRAADRPGTGPGAGPGTG